MKRVIIGLLLCLFICGPLSAQVASNANPPSREDTLKLMEVMRVKRQVETTMSLFSSSFQRTFLTQMKKQFPTLPEALFNDAGVILQKYMEKTAAACKDEMISQMVDVYRQNLTNAEVQKLIEFYSSPIGQQILDKLPLLMQQGAEIGRRVFAQKQPELTKELETEMEKLKQKYANVENSPSK